MVSRGKISPDEKILYHVHNFLLGNDLHRPWDPATKLAQFENSYSEYSHFHVNFCSGALGFKVLKRLNGSETKTQKLKWSSRHSEYELSNDASFGAVSRGL